MNISKTSWHYRLLNKLDMHTNYSYTETLCKYFWKVVAVLVIGPPLIGATLWLGTLPLWWWIATKSLLLPAILVAIPEVVGLSVLLYVIVNERHGQEVWAGTREAREIVVKEPSLLRLWLRAKHRQVCPFIKFVDAE